MSSMERHQPEVMQALARAGTLARRNKIAAKMREAKAAARRGASPSPPRAGPARRDAAAYAMSTAAAATTPQLPPLRLHGAEQAPRSVSAPKALVRARARVDTHAATKTAAAAAAAKRAPERAAPSAGQQRAALRLRAHEQLAEYIEVRTWAPVLLSAPVV
jgi:hypothetical protein